MIFRILISSVLLLLFGASCGANTAGGPAEEDRLVGRPHRAADAPVNHGTLWYGISIREDRLDIAVRLFDPPDGSTRFFLPGPWAGRADHARKLAVGEAHGPNGPAFLTIDRSTGRIDVETPDLDWIELRYAVRLDPSSGDRFTPGYREKVAVLFGPTFLVLPSQQILDRTRAIPVEVHAPDTWNVMATWSTVAEKPSSVHSGIRIHGFLAPDGESLRDAFVVAGGGLRTYAPASTAETTVAFSPNFSGDTEAVTSLIGKVVKGYREEFGGLGATRVYVDASNSGAGQNLGGVGRRGGFILHLPPDATDSKEVALLAAHEALHLWNGHHLVPSPDDEADTRWFKEGVTHYLAIKFGLRWGLFDFDFAARELAEIGSNYLRNPVSRGLEGREVDRARFPYDQGALVALEIDAALAGASDGAVGLEEWIVSLEEIADDGVYTRSDLTRSLRRVAEPIESAAPAILRRHMTSRGPVDLRALFHRADLHWLPAAGARSARVIGLERKDPLYSVLFGAAR